MAHNVRIDEETIKNSLQAILDQIHDTSDPSELNAYRAAFRKYVPFFSRAYVAGWLIKNMTPITPTRQAAQVRKTQPPREGMTSIFIGIGKSRKVFPRDLMSILTEQGGLSKDQIGGIKILDNYSFVEVENDACQALIDTLNNIEYRGRNIAVNFAKKRD